jgi:carbamoyltransferase
MRDTVKGQDMIILGLNAYQPDSSACIVADGKLICAVAEERIRRIKHWAGLPTESIRWCLEYAGVSIKDVDYIAVSRDPLAHLHKRILRTVMEATKLDYLRGRFRYAARVKGIKDSIADALEIDLSRVKAKVQNVEHHKAHLGSTFLVSPLDTALCISVDGFGDLLSTMRGIGRGNKIDVLDWVEFPHSLGAFYTAFTQFLGFWRFGDEYKVMGLSAFGKPVYRDEMRRVLKLNGGGLFELDTSFFLHDKRRVDVIWGNDEAGLQNVLFSNKMVEAFGKPREKGEGITARHQDIAASMQAVYEEAFFHILNNLHQRTGIDRLALAGGCIQNSAANGKIFEKTAFKKIYTPPATGDDGTAVGAAFWVWNVVLDNKRDFIMDSPYLGPEFSDSHIKETLKGKNIGFEKLNDDEVAKRTVKDLADGKIVGWFQGRAEWGPRALGNRSILADPRKGEMKDVLNDTIKKRENFRPFAPSALEQFMSEWFEASHPVPFMEKVYKVRPEKGKLIPAVVHADGTARLHTVSRDINPIYYELIEEFYRLTKVPMLLNTSFNENEPIANTPVDALDCFLRTKMNVLVMGNHYILR